MDPVGDLKRTWRDWARHVRAGLDWPAISLAVGGHLGAWLHEHRGSVVLAFLPLPDEVELTPLFAGRPDLTWAVTRTPEHGPLTIHPLGGELERHRLGFRQPVAGSTEIPPAALDVALAPGLAFDRFGVRLGRGAGYFDELLARTAPGCSLVGVGADPVVVGRLPATGRDVAMGWLATESGVRRVGE